MRHKLSLAQLSRSAPDFPSFSEGLSLRLEEAADDGGDEGEFPFLFGGTFIEACIFGCIVS